MMRESNRICRILLLLPLWATAVCGFISVAPHRKIQRTLVVPSLDASTRRPLKRGSCETLEQSRQPQNSKRIRGERRRKLLSSLRDILSRKWRKLACLLIAVLAYLGGPTLVGSSSLGGGGFDPNVAHAGINVKLSGVQVKATVRDASTLFPPPKLVGAKKSAPPASKRPVTTSNKNIQDHHTELGDRVVTVVLAAGGGILVGNIARRDILKGSSFTDNEPAYVNGDAGQSANGIRRTKTEDFVKTGLKGIQEKGNPYLQSLDKDNPTMNDESDDTSSESTDDSDKKDDLPETPPLS